jgi:excisionase family DNA binding protein
VSSIDANSPLGSGVLRTGDVAKLFHVSPKTVGRWATEGRLPYVRTLGGHRRYRAAGVQALIEKLDRVEVPR